MSTGEIKSVAPAATTTQTTAPAAKPPVETKPAVEAKTTTKAPATDTVAVTKDGGDTKATKTEATTEAPLQVAEADTGATADKATAAKTTRTDDGNGTATTQGAGNTTTVAETDDRPATAKPESSEAGTTDSKSAVDKIQATATDDAEVTTDKKEVPVLADKTNELLGKDEKDLQPEEKEIRSLLEQIQSGELDITKLDDKQKALLAKFLLGEDAKAEDIPQHDLNNAVPTNISSDTTRLQGEKGCSSGSCNSQPHTLSSGRRGRISSSPSLGGWARNNSLDNIGNMPTQAFTPSMPLDKIGVNTEIPQAAAEALHKYGNTFLAYEVSGGKIGDKEAVSSVLLRRLIHYAKTKPNASADDLIRLVAKGWNPGDVKTFEAMHAKVAGKVAKTAANGGEEAIANVLKLDFKSEAGRTVWESGATEFYHPRGMPGGKAPKYYANTQNHGLLAKGHDLQYSIGFSRDGARWTASA